MLQSSRLSNLLDQHNRISNLITAAIRVTANDSQQSLADRPTNMNTTSLFLTGRPAATLSILSSPVRSNQTLPSTPSTTPTSTPSSSPRIRPRQLRRVSSDSTGWYLDADTPSLKDFEVRAQTYAKRLERFASRCATNVVMGLMSPAAVVLFVFNPIMLVLMVLVLIAALSGRV